MSLLSFKPSTKLTADRLSFKKCGFCYELTPQQAEKVRIISYYDDSLEEAAAYQRELKSPKVEDIRQDLLSGTGQPYAPIFLALVDGELECIDGQHRLFGHIAANVNVLAMIVEMSREDANRTFNRDNGKSTRLSNKHMVKVSLNSKAVFMRDLTEAFDISIDQVLVLMMGLRGGSIGDMYGNESFTLDQEDAAQTILSTWTANKKLWRKIEKASNIRRAAGKKEACEPTDAYSGKAVLQALGRYAAENIDNKSKYKRMVRLVSQADWYNKSSRSLRRAAAETGAAGSKQMLDLIKCTIIAEAV